MATVVRIGLLVFLTLLGAAAQAQKIFGGDDGYQLWLKYQALAQSPQAEEYRKFFRSFHVSGRTETADVIRAEVDEALGHLAGRKVRHMSLGSADLIIGTPRSLTLKAPPELTELNADGYLIRWGDVRGPHEPRPRRQLQIMGNSELGALYGTFALLRAMQAGTPLDQLPQYSAPKIQLRVLNHWDNLDRHVERGYAGESIWDWHKLPDYRHQRYYDYARANASIGINGTVLNNVNADPLILTPQYLEKVKALADIFRPYGIRVYLSIKFSSPQLIGGLETSDPLDPKVQEWWRAKAAEIYQMIPDFGGFLVKANSEGQPGPQDFGRTHADGANMLADALAPHGGAVMWRAFVYAFDSSEERSKQAYTEFKPLDGQFRPNVLVQVKNGPIDFQPREPFSPLFGATPKTPLMLELQITHEYLGFSTHMVYSGTLFEEVLDADTYAKGEGSTVAKVIDGSLFEHSISGIAGVANIGGDRNWTGHPMLQSNWYAFGRLAWDPYLSAETIANEWTRMTLGNDPQVVETVVPMLMASREIAVNYMTPLGLHHLMGADHHYGPGPWVDHLGRSDWNSTYYHRADQNGIGIDRSPKGENAVSQYFEPLRSQFSDPATTPQQLLLWFHHLPWDYKLASGETLWQGLTRRYYQGAREVEELAGKWDQLREKIDPLLFQQVEMAFDIQIKEAKWWRDASVLYFQDISKLPLPEDLPPPQVSLESLKALDFPHAPGRGD